MTEKVVACEMTLKVAWQLEDFPGRRRLVLRSLGNERSKERTVIQSQDSSKYGICHRHELPIRDGHVNRDGAMQ
jgi:hypothetical protein